MPTVMRNRWNRIALSATMAGSLLVLPQVGMAREGPMMPRGERPSLVEQAPAPVIRDRAGLTEELVRHGVARQEAERRLASMTDAEVQQLAMNLDAAPAGGDSTITIGVGSAIIIALLLVIFL